MAAPYARPPVNCRPVPEQLEQWSGDPPQGIDGTVDRAVDDGDGHADNRCDQGGGHLPIVHPVMRKGGTLLAPS